VELENKAIEDGLVFSGFSGIPTEGEAPRLLVVPSSEELLCVFASGRIAPLQVFSIPSIDPSELLPKWQQVQIPHEPALGDHLACLMPASQMALADFLVQTSRKGFMKKIRMALVASVMENLYIGTGAKLPGDQTLEVCLAHDGDRYVLVSQEGYLQAVTADMLSFAVEEAVRLNPTDHLISVHTLLPDKSLIVMTQIGKAIHRLTENLVTADALKRKGKGLYSKVRREKGIRVVGSGVAGADDWCIALQKNGEISFHAVKSIIDRGTINVDQEILSFITFPKSKAIQHEI
jgi:hypothetical protein